MERIELELVGDEIAVTVEAEDGSVSTLRRISARDAQMLGVSLMSDAPLETLNLTVGNGVSLQIDPWPHEAAFLEIDSLEGGPSTVAFMEGRVIREIGHCLHGLYHTVGGSSSTRPPAQTFPITFCYLEPLRAIDPHGSDHHR